MTVCQTDGFLFRDMAVVTLVAETIEEIVPVAISRRSLRLVYSSALRKSSCTCRSMGDAFSCTGRSGDRFPGFLRFLFLHSSSVGSVTFTVSGFTFSSRSVERKASGSCDTKNPRPGSLPLVSTLVLSSFSYWLLARAYMRWW